VRFCRVRRAAAVWWRVSGLVAPMSSCWVSTSSSCSRTQCSSSSSPSVQRSSNPAVMEFNKLATSMIVKYLNLRCRVRGMTALLPCESN